MRRTILITVILAVVTVIAAGLLMLAPPQKPATPKAAGPQVCFGSQCYHVELAQTQEELARGLMFRTSLAKDAGMLFIFDADADEPFWMRNTLIPLDMVWIDNDFKVVYIERGAQPCLADPCSQIDPKVLARYVLEVNAGEMDRIGVKTGNQAVINE